ncbi:HipA-like protein [Xanthomonas sp. 60]
MNPDVFNTTPPKALEVSLDGLDYPARSLLATMHVQPIGTLQEHRNLWRFDYAAAWLEQPASFDLSPWLPRASGSILDGSTSRPVQWYFDNLLPEAQQRTRMAQDAGIRGSDDFALLACYGAESAGSLTLMPENAAPSPAHRVPLTDAALSERIGRLPRHSLAAGAEKRMSLAGAQHKLAVIADQQTLYEPVGEEASTHILKPDSTDPDFPHTVINEYFIMRLAATLCTRACFSDRTLRPQGSPRWHATPARPGCLPAPQPPAPRQVRSGKHRSTGHRSTVLPRKAQCA